jgi:hypothetical protein
MRHFKTILTVIGAVTVLVLAANTAAFAATGGKFVLGHKNKASKVSTLKRTTSGPALNLVTKSSSSAPFTANGHGKVTNLNADRVDGLDGASLQTRATVLRIPAESGVSSFYLGLHVPAGLYQVSFSIIARMSSAGAALNCYVLNASDGSYELMGYGSTYGSYSTSNASGVIDTRTGAREVACFTSTGTAIVDYDYAHQSQIVVTRIDGLTTSTAPSARLGSARIAPGTH